MTPHKFEYPPPTISDDRINEK